MTLIGLAVIGGIAGAAVLIILKVKKGTSKKEKERIEGLLGSKTKEYLLFIFNFKI